MGYVRKNPEELKAYSFLEQIKDSWRHGKGYRGTLIFLGVIAILAGLINLLPAFLYGFVVEDLTSGKFDLIFYYLGGIALAYLIYILFDRANDYIGHIKLIESANKIRSRYYNKLFSLDFSFFESNDPGLLVNQISEGTKQIVHFNKVFYRRFLIYCSTVLFSLIALIKIHPQSAIIGVSTAFIYFSWHRFTDYKKIHLEYKTSLIKDRTIGKIVDYLSRIQLAKMLNLRKPLIKQYDRLNEERMIPEKETRWYITKTIFIQKLIRRASYVIVLILLSLSVMKGELAIGLFVAIYVVYERFISAIENVRNTYSNNLLNARPGMFKLCRIDKLESSIPEPKISKKIKAWDSIKIENVSFRYPSKEEGILEKINLEIKKGNKVGVVGLSGSGKSTLSKLISRMYLPTKGDIKFGDVSTTDLKLEELYKKLRVVPQENELLNTTIYENLKFANPSATNKDILESLKRAQLYNFVVSLPKGIHTIVGPNGVKLSGGEKQRLCIARALLSKPEILLLDEATSHLDVLTERKIQENLHRLSKEQTVIAITHRLSSINAFDKIFVMKSGKIVGEGTHQELLRTSLEYQKLWKESRRER
jgi:ABC-type multidrug transport system fused ATPase/permease subunit